MPKDNVITIIVCCYNAEAYLKTCLQSLAYQTARQEDYEILFVNDASTDGSLDILSAYNGRIHNLRVINNKKNIGLTASCNKALVFVETPYFLRLDADDYLSADAITKITGYLSAKREEQFIIFPRWDVYLDNIVEVVIRDDIYTWIAVSTVFRTAAVKQVSGYSDIYWEEYDLYIKLLETGARYSIASDRVYYYRRGHSGSMTQSREKNRTGFEQLREKWGDEILKKYGEFNRFIQYYELNN